MKLKYLLYIPIFIFSQVTAAEKQISLSEVKAQIERYKVTFDGITDKEQIPIGHAYKLALTEIEDTEKMKSFFSQQSNSEIRLVNGTGLFGAEYTNFNKALSEYSEFALNKFCSEIKKFKTQNEKIGQKLGKLINDTRNKEYEFIKKYYEKRILELPKEKSNRLQNKVEELRSRVSYSYIDMASLAMDDENLAIKLFEPGCNK